MSTRLKEKLEKIQKVITELANYSANGTLIVVEGKKDVETLRSLGILGAVITIKTGGKTFVQALNEIERTGVSEVVLLLDFDRRGKEATKYLKENLEVAKIKPDLHYWKFLQAIIGREIQCIESLTAYLETLGKKTL